MYRTQAEDTTIEAERIFFDLVRTLSIETRIMQYHRASIQSQQIWWDLFKERNNIPDKQLKKKYINLKLGEKYCSISQLLDIDFMIASEIDLAIELGEKLDTFWGERRQTADANIVVILEPEKVQEKSSLTLPN